MGCRATPCEISSGERNERVNFKAFNQGFITSIVSNAALTLAFCRGIIISGKHTRFNAASKRLS